MKKTYTEILIPIVLLCISSCTRMQQYAAVDEPLNTFPDYSDVVIPSNIAPLNFHIGRDRRKCMARFVAGRDSFDVYCRNHVVIPIRKWRKLLNDNPGKRLTIHPFIRETDGWVKYRDITLDIASEAIDPYIAYRLIEPGYEFWGKMGIYQRCLETFDETPVLLNTMTDGSCMNCHSFCKNDPRKMLLHVRAAHAGTILNNNGQLAKLDTQTPDHVSAAVYPRWHPGGRYIAFSTNKTSQAFHSANKNLVEVYDSASDLMIYDTETQSIFTHPLIHSSDRLETFPEWSPDGKSLYFCSAPAVEMPDHYDSLRYDLFRVDFDPQTGKIGNKTDTVLQPSKTGKSIAFPRISPDGRHMVVCLSGYGTFPVWHRDNDLYVLNVETGGLTPASELNSAESDSYHSWSTNGRWIVFSSRRMDGLYTRPYIACFDSGGRFHKPFLLPQKDPLFYDGFLQSYNVPEFVSGKIETGIRTLERIVKGDATGVRAAENNQ
ncbi:MAG: hypothetical protein LBL04_05915 [Bacteroidales bacterium]|nr:hypothetical protein [Bacteroidales bacterium]